MFVLFCEHFKLGLMHLLHDVVVSHFSDAYIHVCGCRLLD